MGGAGLRTSGSAGRGLGCRAAPCSAGLMLPVNLPQNVWENLPAHSGGAGKAMQELGKHSSQSSSLRCLFTFPHSHPSNLLHFEVREGFLNFTSAFAYLKTMCFCIHFHNMAIISLSPTFLCTVSRQILLHYLLLCLVVGKLRADIGT